MYDEDGQPLPPELAPAFDLRPDCVPYLEAYHTLARSWRGRRDGMTGQEPAIPFPWIVKYARLDGLPWRRTVRLVQEIEAEVAEWEREQRTLDGGEEQGTEPPPER